MCMMGHEPTPEFSDSEAQARHLIIFALCVVDIVLLVVLILRDLGKI